MKSAKKIMLFQACILIFMLLLWSVPILELFFKAITNIVAYGVSNFKVYLPFIYLFLLSFTWYFKPRTSKKYIKASAIGFLLLFSLGVAEFLYLTHQYDLPLARRSVFVVDGEHSSTHLGHIHNSKLVMGAFSAVLGDLVLQNYDPGVAFVDYYPSWLVILHALLFFGTFLLVILSHLEARHFFPKPFYVLYFISTFVLIKDSLDGGIFNAEVTIAVAIYLALLHYFIKKSYYSYFQIQCFYFFVCYGIYGIMYFTFDFIAKGIFTLFCLSGLLYGSFALFFTKRYRYLSLIGYSLLLITLFFLPIRWYVPTPYFHAITPIPTNSTFALNSHHTFEGHPLVNITDHYTLGELNLYYAHVLEETPFYPLRSAFHVNLNFNRLSVDPFNCNILKNYTSRGTFYTEQTPQLFDLTSEHAIQNYSVSSSGEGWYEFKIVHHPCTPHSELWQLELLKELGLTRYILN